MTITLCVLCFIAGTIIGAIIALLAVAASRYDDR